MSEHDFQTLKKRLASCEPIVSESLTDDVLRDVEAVLNSPKHGPQRFNAQRHCTKKSRCRATFLGTLLGVSLGLLLGVMLALAMSGQREKQIVYVEVPVEKESQATQNRESQPARKPDRAQNDNHALLARNANLESLSEIDRLIEETLEQRQRIVIPDSLRSQYVDRRYVSSLGTISPDRNLLLLQRELLECYR